MDATESQQWATSTSQLLTSLFGRESDYSLQFQNTFRHAGDYHEMKSGLGVLTAAWNDYSKGYLFETSGLIRAEVFDDFLELAKHLLEQGYHGPAGVVAGVVLENTLRKLCDKNEVTLSPRPKLDSMNSELAKKGVYNTLVQKRITWLADIRNKAAHGDWSGFTAADVEAMLGQVRNFVTDYLT